MTPIQLTCSASVTTTSAGVIIRSDLGTFQVAGADAQAFLTRIVPLLDGSRDRGAVIAALGGYAPESVSRFLDRLVERGLVEEVADPDRDEPRRGQLEFLRRWSVAPSAALERLASARLLLAGYEPWGDVAVAELRAAGIGAIDRLEEGKIDVGTSLLIPALAPEDVAEAGRVAGIAHRAGVRTLWSHLDGARAVIGPFTVPGRTACRICASAEALNPPLSERTAHGPRTAIMARLLGHLVATEVVKIVSGYTRSMLGGRILIQDLVTFETRLHTLVRLPWCRVCGAEAAGA